MLNQMIISLVTTVLHFLNFVAIIFGIIICLLFLIVIIIILGFVISVFNFIAVIFNIYNYSQFLKFFFVLS